MILFTVNYFPITVCGQEFYSLLIWQLLQGHLNTVILRTWLAFISHVAVDLWPGIPLSEFNALHVALHCLLDDVVQRLVLGK